MLEAIYTPNTSPLGKIPPEDCCVGSIQFSKFPGQGPIGYVELIISPEESTIGVESDMTIG